MLPRPLLSEYIASRIAETCIDGVILVVDGQEFRVKATCEKVAGIVVRIKPDLSGVGYTIGLVSKLSLLIRNPLIGSAIFEYYNEVVLFDLQTGGIPIEFLHEILIYS